MYVYKTMSAVVALQHDPTNFINYIGTDPDYYPDGGPVVVPELHTARVSGYDLDTLEIASHGKVVFTTNETSKALEISGLGVVDPNVVDTTVIDSGENSLKLMSDKDVDIEANEVNISSSELYHSTITPDVEDGSTFHHRATPSEMKFGTGVLAEDGAIVSGSFLTTTADAFELTSPNATIKSLPGVEGKIRYEATGSHEFFVGSDASTQSHGSGAIQITSDKVIIRKDVDLVGSLNSITSDATTLSVEDQIIRLAHTDDPETKNRDVLLSQSKTGITINTVPGSYSDDGDYMSGFLSADGSKMFVDDAAEEILVDKALDSGVFDKEFAYYLNGGAKSAGKTTTESRLAEPYWNLSGGALHLSHTVPAGNGKVKKFSLGFRITDEGNMEMVRLTKFLEWDSVGSTYVNDSSIMDTVSVIAKYVNGTPM